MGEDVKSLQRFLNNQGFIVAESGKIGSIGFESNYFGDITRESLARFQYRNNIEPAFGYFGTTTRQLINSMISR